MSSADPPRATVLLAALEAELAVSHAVGLPDNATAALFALLQGHPRIRAVPVTREGEAFAVAAGLCVGGAAPLVVVQNTGLLESGDALRGTALRMGIPLLLLVSYRGYGKTADRVALPPAGPLTPEALTDPGLDSVALLTEPTLEAWGVPRYRYGADGDASQLAAAARRARVESRPVAVLLTRALT